MLKTKLIFAIRKLSFPNKTKKQKILIYVAILLLLGLIFFLLGHIKSDSAQQKQVKSRDAAGGLLANDDYAGAAKKLEAVYNKDTDDSSKANDAFNIGSAYQSKQDYDSAIYWYNKALVSYRAAGDKNGQAETIQAIAAAKKFKESHGKIPADSPVDKGE